VCLSSALNTATAIVVVSSVDSVCHSPFMSMCPDSLELSFLPLTAEYLCVR